MDVELVPAYMDRKLFIKMAQDYINGLNEYDSSIQWDELTWQEYAWSACFVMEDRVVQGFIVSQDIPYKVFPNIRYIEEFYIVPEARKRGIGIAAIEALMKDWHEDVFLYILNGNFTAKVFWGSVEKKLKWRRIQRPEIKQEQGCELRVYNVY